MNRFFYLFIALLFATMVNAQVGIGTATPKASAALDITSTTQGFLPPRMNSAERDLIPSPDAGLTIYNTTTQAIEFWNGSGWISTIYTPSAPVTHFIGESYGGGIVFYVTPNALHGLIAETQDLLFSSWFDAHEFHEWFGGSQCSGAKLYRLESTHKIRVK